MGKFRSKLKGATKGKRWAKGQSSSSNPETKKYRDIARSRFFQENLGQSKLTLDAVQRHEATTQELKMDAESAFAPSEQPESVDIGDNFTDYSCDTFASQWTACSNVSFNRFLRTFRSDSALHKDMLAVLAAITEVIKENGGGETPTEYYCALLTALDQGLSTEIPEAQVTPILALLDMGIKKVPVAVLRKSFSDFVPKLLHVLSEFSGSDNNVVMKSTFGILGVLLQAQEAAAWTSSVTTQVFNTILNPFCIHSKPKWRRGAQQAAITVASSLNSPNVAADKIAEFCEQVLSACMGESSASPHTGQTTILHVLGLMKYTIHLFNKNHIKTCCERILRLMTLNYPLVTSCGFQVLHALFTQQTATISEKLNGQLVSALYDYQPSSSDSKPIVSWIEVMQQAHVHLSDVDLGMACLALPRIFTTLSQLWLSDKTEVTSAVAHAFKNLLKDAVAPACDTPQLVEQHRSKLLKCFSIIEGCLKYQYNTVWHQVLHVISIMFEVAGKNASDLLQTTLRSLAELRDSYKFSFNNELEHAVGAAVRSMGPETVLKVISLKKEDGDLNLNRSWVLQLLKENVKAASLEYWLREIMSLAVYCQQRSAELSARSDGIGAHSYELLYLQLWSLLPSFCNRPSDIKTNFKSIAKILGTAVAESKELRLVVMASLRKLIAVSSEVGNEDDLAEIARFDKNYLPVLFNLYTSKAIGSEEEGHRLAALETIKVFLVIAKPELTEQLYNNALEKVKAEEDSSAEATDSFVKESVLDLVRALMPYQTTDRISELYHSCIKVLPDLKNHREQKKAYRLLEEICKSESEGCKSFVRNNRKTVQRLLMGSLGSTAVSSKGARLRCLDYLVKAQPKLDADSKLFQAAIPEAVVACKDLNQKCREAAFQLLIDIGETLIGHDQTQQYVGMLVAGLTGDVKLVSCTIVALSSILRHFTGSLGTENIKGILEAITTLMESPTREVVGSCIGFVKVYCTSIPSPTVATSLPIIMKGLTSMTDDCKRHFRLKVRYLLDLLVRKYGCDSLTPHVPLSDTVMYKRLRAVRKLQAQKKRQRDAKDGEDEEDEDGEEEFVVRSGSKSVEDILTDSDSEIEDMETDQAPRTKRKQISTWINEDESTIVDFTDPTTASRITVTNPKQKTVAQFDPKQKRNRGFKTAADGRLIIDGLSGDSDDDTRGKSKRNTGNKRDDDDDEDNDDFDDALTSAETLPLSNDKKRKSDTASLKSSASGQANKYQAGGSGIHRPVAASSKSFGAEYRSKKAKGDVKKKGKPEPYSYLPLKRTALNKRKKMKMAGQYKNIVKAAQKGARKGGKARR